MNNIDEAALISLVRKYPLLYDVTSPLYNDQQKKDEAWNEISSLTSAAAYDCKMKWTRLRDNYRKALIVRNKSFGRVTDRAVKYEKDLSFLNEKFSFRLKKRHSFVPIETEPTLLEPTEPKKTNLPALESTSSNKAPKKQAAVSKPAHEMNVFFDGIAETVKTFPKKMQIQLKRQIFNLVNDAEASLLTVENDNTMHYSTMPGHAMSSPMEDLSEYEEIGSTEYASSTTNQMQNITESTPEQFCNVQIKEERPDQISITIKQENI